MSENPQKASGGGITGAMIAEKLATNYERLPDFEKKLFTYGPMYLGGNAGLAGLIANSLFRRTLNVTQAPVASSLPMAVLPFIATFAMYSAAVSVPLVSGDLNCSSCALMRGALVGVLGGWVYPVVLALPVNIALATRYNSAPVPVKGNLFRYWLSLCNPIMGRMRAVAVLQAMFGTYLASRHFDIYTNLVQLTFASGEELKD